MGSSQEEVFRSKHQDDGLELLPFFDEQLPGPCQQGREEMQRHHGGGDGGHGGAQDVGRGSPVALGAGSVVRAEAPLGAAGVYEAPICRGGQVPVQHLQHSALPRDETLGGDDHLPTVVDPRGGVGGRGSCGGVSVGVRSDVGRSPRPVDPMSYHHQSQWSGTALQVQPMSMSRIGIPAAAIPLARYGMVDPLPSPMKSSPVHHGTSTLPKRKFLLSPPPANWKYTVDEVMADAAEAGPNSVRETLYGSDKSTNTVSSQAGVRNVGLNPKPYSLLPKP